MIILTERSGLTVRVNPDHIVLYNALRLQGQNDYVTKILLSIGSSLEVTETPEDIDVLVCEYVARIARELDAPLDENEDEGVQADERF